MLCLTSDGLKQEQAQAQAQAVIGIMIQDRDDIHEQEDDVTVSTNDENQEQIAQTACQRQRCLSLCSTNVEVPYAHTRLVRRCFWASNVFRFWDDWPISAGCVTCFCPCVTFGRIAEIAEQRLSCRMHGFVYCCLSLLCVQNLYSFVIRTKLRAKYGLPNLPCNDCFIHCFCEKCALCQERREIYYRTGWLDIVTLGPPVKQEMEK